jgi:hypothetical protein
MKKIQFIILVIILTTSCKKVFDVKPDDFNVTLLNTPSKVGDTAKFAIDGNPDFITFYSGENGSNYEYRNRTFADSSIPQINFTSFGQNLSALHPNSLSLLVSSNYNGDTLNITNSIWTDITSRAILSTGATNTPSGTISLADFRKFDSVYVAFRYATSSGINAIQPSWAIQSFNLNNISFPDSTVHIINTISNSGWQVTDILPTNNRWAVTSTQLSITSAPSLSSGNNDWAITKVFLKRVNPDKGLPIKQIFEKIDNYSYRFNKVGKYTVVFVGSNKKYENDYEVIKKLEINIK